MENAAHTLSGLVLARLGGADSRPLSTALLVTAANFPDIDGIALAFGRRAYLDWHHGITHSLLGLLVAGPLLAVVFHRLAVWRGHRVTFGPYLGLAWLGLAAHGFLDTLISYGMRPWLPFDDTWYYGDVVFVVDPWVWVILGAGAALGGRRHGRGWLAWAGFAVATVVVTAIAAASGRTAAGVPWVLGGLWGVVLGLRWFGVGAGRRRGYAGGALVVLGLYLGGLFLVGRANHEVGVAAIRERLGGVPVQATSTLAAPGRPLAHRVFVQTRDHVYYADVDAGAGTVAHGVPLRRNLDDPGLRSVRHTPEYESWQGFARHPFAGRRGEAWILGDARFSWRVQEAWCNLRVDAR